jgi:hypothetical protein
MDGVVHPVPGSRAGGNGVVQLVPGGWLELEGKLVPEDRAGGVLAASGRGSGCGSPAPVLNQHKKTCRVVFN